MDKSSLVGRQMEQSRYGNYRLAFCFAPLKDILTSLCRLLLVLMGRRLLRQVQITRSRYGNCLLVNYSTLSQIMFMMSLLAPMDRHLPVVIRRSRYGTYRLVISFVHGLGT